MPPLFQFLTVLAFKIFISEQVCHPYFNDSSSCHLLFLFLLFHGINLLQQLVIVDNYTLIWCILLFFGAFPLVFPLNIVAENVFFYRLMLLSLKLAWGGRMIPQMLYVSNFRSTKYVFMKFSMCRTIFFSFTSPWNIIRNRENKLKFYLLLEQTWRHKRKKLYIHMMVMELGCKPCR